MDLREKANDESSRLTNLLLGFSAAAIAYGAHEVSAWTMSVSAGIAALSGLAWAGSFLAGMARGHAVFDVIRYNGAMNEAGSQHPRYVEVKELFDRANGRAKGAYFWQRWLLFSGAAIFAVAVGAHLPKSTDAANDRRCLAIQRDMLAAHPNRSDDPILFHALGCRPQGNGSVYRQPTKAELSSVN